MLPRRLPLVLCGLLSAGCTGTPGALTYASCTETGEGYTLCEPSGAPLPSGATLPPPPVPVRANQTELAGVRLGTAQAQAVPALTALLGEPEVEETPCLRAELLETLAQPRRGSELRWPGLTAYFTPDAAGRTVLTGWEIHPSYERWQRYAFRLPYSVQLKDEVPDALRELPEPRTRVPVDGRRAGVFTITTPQVRYLEWRSYENDDSGTVEEIAYDPEGCG